MTTSLDRKLERVRRDIEAQKAAAANAAKPRDGLTKPNSDAQATQSKTPGGPTKVVDPLGGWLTICPGCSKILHHTTDPDNYPAASEEWFCGKCLSGAPQSQSELSAFEAWLSAEAPSGDAESVQYQWAQSDARAEWLEGQSS